MNENINLSNYTAIIRIGNDSKHIDLVFLAAICDKFLFEELCDFIAQSPLGSIVYSGYRNKTRFSIIVSPKDS